MYGSKQLPTATATLVDTLDYHSSIDKHPKDLDKLRSWPNNGNSSNNSNVNRNSSVNSYSNPNSPSRRRDSHNANNFDSNSNRIINTETENENESNPTVQYSIKSRTSDEKKGKSFLLNEKNNWPLGLVNAVYSSCQKMPLRFVIVDDSGSMITCDGNRVVGSDNNQKMIKCTRWSELTASLKFHAHLANAFQGTFALFCLFVCN